MVTISPTGNKIILAAALSYLLLPCLCFLYGWVEPEISVFAVILLIIGLFQVVRDVPSFTLQCSRKDLICLVATLFMCALLVEGVGFTGRALQPTDFFVRNPIYETLVRDEWPISEPSGDYFVYYIAWWLPPAMLCKILGGGINPHAILACWTLMGLVLATLVLFMRLKGRILGFFLILLLLGSVTDWIVRYSDLFQSIPAGNVGIEKFCHFLQILPGKTLPGPWIGSFAQTFHQHVPVYVLLCLLFSRALPWQHWLFASSLIVLPSPLGSVTVFMLLMIRLFPYLIKKGSVKKALRTVSLWCCLPLLIIALIYYSCGQGSVAKLVCFDWSVRGSFWWYALDYMVLLCKILIPAIFFFWSRYRRCTLLWFVLAAYAFITFVHVGGEELSANNELLYKGSQPVFFCLALLYLSLWKYSKAFYKAILSIWFFLSAGSFIWYIQRSVCSYTWDPIRMEQNMNKEWQGHMNHPECKEYKNFWTSSPVPYPLRGSEK